MNPSTHKYRSSFRKRSLNIPRIFLPKITINYNNLKNFILLLIIVFIVFLTFFSAWIAFKIISFEEERRKHFQYSMEQELTPIKAQIYDLKDRVGYLEAHVQPIVIYEIKQKIPVRVKK